MDKIEVVDIKKYLKNSKFIGVGTTAICFLMPNGKVAKIFYDMPGSSDFYIDRFEKMSSYGNDTFITPQELLIKDGKLIGYTYPYIDAKTLKFTSPFVKIDDFLSNYETYLKDAKSFSESLFVPSDLHGGNILYDHGKCFIIDLDRGRTYNDPNLVYKMNAKRFMTSYMNKIFKANLDQLINFYNFYLQRDYVNTNWTNMNEVSNFFDYLYQCVGKSSPTIHDIRVKHLAYKEIDEYHKY